MEQPISRKAFVAGAAGGVALAALHAQAAGADEASAAWDYQADVVVVGAGMTGLFAAMEALDAGSTVLIVEKAPEEEAGGDSRCFGGILTADLTPAVNIARSLNELEQDIADVIYEYGNGMTQWFHDYTDLEWRTPGICDGGGFAAWNAVTDMVKEYEDVEFLYGTPVVDLLFDDEGECTGVLATQGENTVRIGANQGVILCSGGYEANNQLMNDLHYPGMEIFTVGSPYLTGDGLKMAMKAGAALEQVGDSIDWFEFAYAEPSRQYGTGITSRLWDTMESADDRNATAALVNSRVFVDMQGRRFMDELTMNTHDKRHNLAFISATGRRNDSEWKYNHYPFFMVCDQACVDSAPLGRVPTDENWEWVHVQDIYRWSDDNQAEVEAGWLIKADTIEELVSKMSAKIYKSDQVVNMNVEGLKATIEAYNAACESGDDEYRDAATLVPIAQPPFYAIEMAPCAVYTVGGVKTNADSQIVDWNDNPIPRLYAAGNIGQGLALKVFGIIGCIARARMAGIVASSLDPIA
jgi:succinate dehydrogenase/fumarate reductase flavoprotein subunit